MMNLLKILTLTIGLTLASAGVSCSAILNLTRDAAGWTVFTPAADSRIVYISADGNDSTGGVYTTASAQVGSNPKLPVGTVNPFKTYAAAYANTRENYPDWILFKRGDTFDYTAADSRIRSGRSTSEPFLISDYGATGAPPIINHRSTRGFYISGNKAYIAIANLDLYQFHRNPEDPRYVVNDNGTQTIFFYASGTQRCHDILIEGNRFAYHNGIAIQGRETANTYNIEFRRNVVLSAYSYSTDRPQGMYTSHLDNFIQQENVFDHNGWYSTVQSGGIGSASMFNQNMYNTNTHNGLIADNVSTRPSSIHIKQTANHLNPVTFQPMPTDYAIDSENVTIRDNLLLSGEVGLELGGNDETKRRFRNYTVTGNVLTNINIEHPTNRDIGFGYDIRDWDGGTFSNNLITHCDEPNSFGVSVRGSLRNVTFSNNVIYDWKKLLRGLYLTDVNGSETSNMVWSNNTVWADSETTGTRVVDATYATTGKWSFSGNKYYTLGTDGSRFRVAGANVTNTAYTSATGDSFTWASSGHGFPDASRGIESYMASIGETPTQAAYIELIRQMHRYNWDTRLLAPTITAYIKAGYNIGGSAPTPVCDAQHLYLCTTESTCTAASGYFCGSACQAAPCPVTPTCFDGIKNGAETDVDCGGDTCQACVDPLARKVRQARVSTSVKYSSGTTNQN